MPFVDSEYLKIVEWIIVMFPLAFVVSSGFRSIVRLLIDFIHAYEDRTRIMSDYGFIIKLLLEHSKRDEIKKEIEKDERR